MTSHSIKKVAIIPYDQYISFIKAKNKDSESSSDGPILKSNLQTGGGTDNLTLKDSKPVEESRLNIVNKKDSDSNISKDSPKNELISPEDKEIETEAPTSVDTAYSISHESNKTRSGPPPPGFPSLKRKISFLNDWVD